MTVQYAPGLSVNWTAKELQRIKKIRARSNRKPQRIAFISNDHPFNDIILRKEQPAEKPIKINKMDLRRKHQEAVIALLDSGMTRLQIAKLMNVTYMSIVKIVWRYKQKCQK